MTAALHPGDGGGEPTVARTVTVPPAPASDRAAGSDAGGWEQRLSALRGWFASQAGSMGWRELGTPLLALAALVSAVVALRVYGALIDAIDGIPLLPGLLELVGLIWLLRRGAPRLVRSGERQRLLADLQDRWRSCRGQ